MQRSATEAVNPGQHFLLSACKGTTFFSPSQVNLQIINTFTIFFIIYQHKSPLSLAPFRNNSYLCNNVNQATEQMNEAPSYRPHNPGHDYYDRGVYLITLVVTERERCLSTLNDNISTPAVSLLPTGTIVTEEWEKTAEIQHQKGRHIKILAQVAMPDHWHGIIIVEQRMNISLGAIINAFKSVCTSRWRKEVTGYVQMPCTAALIRRLSKENRRAYYATRPRIERPLFDDDYDDTICLNEDHRRRMVAYVADNPRRAIYRRLFPQFMQRQLHVVIGSHDYAAFGNLFLLRWANKRQVFCHRKARLHQLNDDERQHYGYTYAASPDLTTTIPYEQTADYRNQHDTLVAEILNGATVVVTPGISKGELQIKNECLERHFPLIHLQKEPIGRYWKPEQSRFDACTNGALLILAPWHLDDMPQQGAVPSSTDYSRFHNLNALAADICAFDGDARIVRDR